jgi:hypothetical protein
MIRYGILTRFERAVLALAIVLTIIATWSKLC